jgi:hypothetical protein
MNEPSSIMSKKIDGQEHSVGVAFDKLESLLKELGLSNRCEKELLTLVCIKRGLKVSPVHAVPPTPMEKGKGKTVVKPPKIPANPETKKIRKEISALNDAIKTESVKIGHRLGEDHEMIVLRQRLFCGLKEAKGAPMSPNS